MTTNDGNSTDTGLGQKVRIVVGLVLLAVISYEAGSQPRQSGEKRSSVR